MNLIEYLEQTKMQIKAQEEQELEVIKQKIAIDNAPKNQEIEQIKAEELNKITIKYEKDRNSIIANNEKQLVALSEKFEKEKNTVLELAEKKKDELYKTSLASASYEITKKYEKVVASITSQIEELKG